ncbi:hypothetical protein J3E68DRAFT_399067, partial [Trichoderma sp. SZMC 28012]
MQRTSIMSENWTLDTFTVATTTPEGDKDVLYANGTMQVLVVVTVSAVNDDNTPHMLTDDELSSIKLIDYYNPSSDLSDGWTYSTIENRYDHTIGSPTAEETVAIDLSPPKQFQRYWVSTATVEGKDIGASIKAQDGSVVDTSGSGTFDSKVNITGIKPIDVHFEDLDLWQDTNTANGDIGSDYFYDQDNYYLTIKNQNVRFLDCYGFDGGSSDPNLYRSIAVFSNGLLCYIGYWWPVGPTSEVTAGFRDVNVKITVNQQKDAACLTRLLIGGPRIWNTHQRWEAKFTVYDQYGNSCVFYPKWVDDGNTLQLSKSRTD